VACRWPEPARWAAQNNKYCVAGTTKFLIDFKKVATKCVIQTCIWDEMEGQEEIRNDGGKIRRHLQEYVG